MIPVGFMVSRPLSHVLATASSDRDGGQREGTTQRMRPGSAAARVAMHNQCRVGLRVIAERLRVEWGVSLLLHLTGQELMRYFGRL